MQFSCHRDFLTGVVLGVFFKANVNRLAHMNLVDLAK